MPIIWYIFDTCITKGSSVLSTVLVFISKFLGFHFKDKSPLDPILTTGRLLWKYNTLLLFGRDYCKVNENRPSSRISSSKKSKIL